MMKNFVLYLLVVLLAPILHAQNGAEEQSAVPPSIRADQCRALVDQLVVHFKNLGRALPSGFKALPNISTHRLLSLTADDCSNSMTPKIIERALNLHTGKIGILLPLSQWPTDLRQNVTQHINRLVQNLGIDPAQNLIWMDTAAQAGRLESQLAQLVFMNHVGIVIGGLTQGEAQILGRWGDALRIPTLILNRRIPKLASKHIFYLGPDARLLASSLTRHSLSRGLRRIAILMPQSSRDGPIVDQFISQSQHLRLDISGPYLYNSNDYSSIDGVLRKILHIDDPSRGEEELELIRVLKEKASGEGMAFESRNVVLPAALDVDAILIADNFKNVRHIAKALAYYGVKHLPLLGVPKWRAHELVEGHDEILNGSVFVDYIGSYQKLPYRIETTSLGSEFFVPSSEIDAVDLKLLLSHAVYAASQVLSGPRVHRPQIYKRLESVRPQTNEFFAVPTIFKKDHVAYWPSFLFSRGEQQIQLMQVWNPILSDAQNP